MDDPYNPNNIIGKTLVVGLVSLAIWGVTAFIRAKGEGARRARMVVGGVIALFAAWVVFVGSGPGGLIATVAAIAAVVWVVKGYKK